jgi:hypothetical protein
MVVAETKWKPGDKALIVPAYTPCEVDKVLGAMHVGVWVPSHRYAMHYRIVNPIELEPLP